MLRCTSAKREFLPSAYCYCCRMITLSSLLVFKHPQSATCTCVVVPVLVPWPRSMEVARGTVCAPPTTVLDPRTWPAKFCRPSSCSRWLRRTPMGECLSIVSTRSHIVKQRLDFVGVLHCKARRGELICESNEFEHMCTLHFFWGFFNALSSYMASSLTVYKLAFAWCGVF